MFIRTDDGSVDGVFKTDCYVDARLFSPAELACFVHERADLAAYADAYRTRIDRAKPRSYPVVGLALYRY